jgi:hypothetical protein
MMADLQRQIQESQSKSLSFNSVLFNCYNFKSKDPRDKIFGVQGLCTRDGINLIAADYKNSAAQVYQDAAYLLFKENPPLRLLSYTGRGYFSKSSEVGDLPSWCPDWSRQPKIGILSYKDPQINYQAGGEEDGMPQIFQFTDLFSLILRDRFIDTIVSLAPFFYRLPDDATGKRPVSKMTDLYKSIVKSYRKILRSPFGQKPYTYTTSPQPVYVAYWRTLIGDRSETTRPAPHHLKRASRSGTKCSEKCFRVSH